MSQSMPQSPPRPPEDSVRGFLPDDEGRQLYDWALGATAGGPPFGLRKLHKLTTPWFSP